MTNSTQYRTATRLVHGGIQRSQFGETAEALYWFTDGRRQFAGPVEFWWRTAVRRLTFGRSSGAPILVILTSTGQEPPDWSLLLQNWPDLQGL